MKMNIHSRRAAPESYNYTYVLTRIWILAINAPETRRLIRHICRHKKLTRSDPFHSIPFRSVPFRSNPRLTSVSQELRNGALAVDFRIVQKRAENCDATGRDGRNWEAAADKNIREVTLDLFRSTIVNLDSTRASPAASSSRPNLYSRDDTFVGAHRAGNRARTDERRVASRRVLSNFNVSNCGVEKPQVVVLRRIFRLRRGGRARPGHPNADTDRQRAAAVHPHLLLSSAVRSAYSKYSYKSKNCTYAQQRPALAALLATATATASATQPHRHLHLHLRSKKSRNRILPTRYYAGRSTAPFLVNSYLRTGIPSEHEDQSAVAAAAAAARKAAGTADCRPTADCR
ncbi:hypothetical protein V9T40_000213 [Parthenolecanium corni]|uniref:Uncharacterized protein n=1 Tax=Parthenolecanium corni TaxID=536013 RepID=A0AAN9Y0A6_9HEMI